jgi:hypothetical protein
VTVVTVSSFGTIELVVGPGPGGAAPIDVIDFVTTNVLGNFYFSSSNPGYAAESSWAATTDACRR